MSARCLVRGPCLAQTIWAGSRERFLVLVVNGSIRNRDWGLPNRDRPGREKRQVPGPDWIDRAVPVAVFTSLCLFIFSVKKHWSSHEHELERRRSVKNLYHSIELAHKLLE